MAVKEGYDVLRLIEHGQVCYISSEYVAGKSLAVWLKIPSPPAKRAAAWLDPVYGAAAGRCCTSVKIIPAAGMSIPTV